MATMETKRNKKIAVLAVILVLAIGLVIGLLLWNHKEREKKDLQQVSRDLTEAATLEVGESTPQSVFDKIEEKESLEAQKQAEESASIEKAMKESLEAEALRASEALEVSGAEETATVTEEVTSAEAENTSSEETKSVTADETKPYESEVASSSQTKTETETPVNVGAGSAPDTRVVDFASLQAKKNAHIYAWVSVPGTNVDYPVLRHPTDDGYYLYHNLNGSSGYPGCIYTENWNSMDWTDPVTVLYGHDMRSTGTMFHQLHKFEKQDFFDKNQYIYIYTPEKTLKYWIFATYVHSNEHLLYNHNFSNKDEFDSFFNTVLSSAGGVNHVREGASISSDSKIITLSTCIKNKPENRYLIFGVLQ